MTDQEIKLACYREACNLEDAKELYKWVVSEDVVLSGGPSGASIHFVSGKGDPLESTFGPDSCYQK